MVRRTSDQFFVIIRVMIKNIRRRRILLRRKKLKYIFVAGGVMSGVGKGVAVSSIGNILQSRGLKVTAAKIDPYVNVDAGTMNPTEHGEVFVLDDGMECDQDMGNYERFLNCNLTRINYMTTGSIYTNVIRKERDLEFEGKCVEVVPHIPLEVINKLNLAAQKVNADIIITEIGGTVGEYQNVLFLEAVRMLKLKHPGDVLLVLVSYLPLLGKDNELKTKPTQYAVRTLNATGLQPDIIIARANVALDNKRKEKIAFNCNVRVEDVISAPDVTNIYEIPLNFEKDNLSSRILKKIGLKSKKQDLKNWIKFVNIANRVKKPLKIGIVGKYFGTGSFVLADSYISVIEAIKHACYALGFKPIIEWLDAENIDLQNLKTFNGIVVPGGFGSRGVDGKIKVIKFCRENKIPYLGLCYGMQLAVVEFSRSILKWKSAQTTEIDQKTSYPVIDILPEQKKNIVAKHYGASMRLGAYPAILKNGTIASKAYGVSEISERHRHRYEVNPQYIEKLENAGLKFSGVSPNGQLMEIVELSRQEHPFFVGTQFHPEFKSQPLTPHPLFLEFIKAAKKQK